MTRCSWESTSHATKFSRTITTGSSSKRCSCASAGNANNAAPTSPTYLRAASHMRADVPSDPRTLGSYRRTADEDGNSPLFGGAFKPPSPSAKSRPSRDQLHPGKRTAGCQRNKTSSIQPRSSRDSAPPRSAPPPQSPPRHRSTAHPGRPLIQPHRCAHKTSSSEIIFRFYFFFFLCSGDIGRSRSASNFSFPKK